LNYLPRLALNHSPLDLCLLSSHWPSLISILKLTGALYWKLSVQLESEDNSGLNSKAELNRTMKLGKYSWSWTYANFKELLSKYIFRLPQT
jgi:hypothetical protein